ncbi:histidinol phosphate aminotransferase [Tropicibacter sp. S64]|uniref:histidinol phosphate aminotransferase n=1 Tax=Tropicibacter sp. S64 TaxID=3415122 RepID=UPI003C7C466C
MEKHFKAVAEYTAANLVLVFVNVLWIFAAIWSAWGLGPVLILAALLNHAITRIDFHQRRVAAKFEKIEEI